MSIPAGQGRSSACLSDCGSQCGRWLVVALGLRETVAGRILETSGGPWKSPTAQEAKLRELVSTRRLFVSDLTELWGVVTKILAVTGRCFGDKDFRGGLENGILLCELLSSIKPGLVKKINRLPTPIAGL
eukprot:superscaffoldBa00001597_g11241